MSKQHKTKTIVKIEKFPELDVFISLSVYHIINTVVKLK